MSLAERGSSLKKSISTKFFKTNSSKSLLLSRKSSFTTKKKSGVVKNTKVIQKPEAVECE